MSTAPSPGGRPGAGAERRSVLLVGSSGGHLAQLVALRSWWQHWDARWVTFPTADAVDLLGGQHVTYAAHPTTRNVPNLLRNLVLAARLLRADRPDVIVSSGAGVAVPFFVLGRLLGIPTVYLEVFDRVDSATLTGRLCRPFTDRMLVQWDEQLGLYRDAVVVGPVL